MEFEGTQTDAPELATQPATQDAQSNPEPSEPAEEPIDLDAQAEQPSEESDGETVEGEETAEGTEDPQGDAEEFVPVEIDGKVYNLPPELKDGYLRQADYTRKTQEVAEMRRHAEAQIEQAKETLSASQEVIEARAALFNIDQQLQRFQETDWNKLEEEDPLGAYSSWRQFQQMKEARQNVAGFLDQRQGEFAQRAEQETATRLEATLSYAKEKIPGWSPDMDARITEFATSELGFTVDMLKQAYNPQVYQTLFYAWLGHQAAQKQQATPKANVPQPKPLRKVTGNGSVPVQKSPEDMSAAEYAAWRKTPAGRQF